MPTAIETYKKAIYRLNPAVTTAEWDYFESGLSTRDFAAREYFIEAGKKYHELGFVARGLIRQYYVDDRGEEITISFSSENEFATDYISLLNGTPCRYTFQCLEPSVVVSVSISHIREGYDLFRGFERNGRLIAEETLIRQQKRIERFQFDSAERRYTDFVSENPELFNRVTLTHLASYLGIERASLSRIRKKISGT